MKTCKCGNIIPRSVNIDGKSRNLKNRTKCLSCLPFGKSLYRKKTAEEYRTRKAKNQRDRYYRLKKAGIDSVKINRNSKKLYVIELLGGRCQICGYNTVIRNLVFHHLNNKEFELSSRSFQFSWKKLLPELLKCILVCHNCHGEIHHGIIPDSTVIECSRKFQSVFKNFRGPVP